MLFPLRSDAALQQDIEESAHSKTREDLADIGESSCELVSRSDRSGGIP